MSPHRADPRAATPAVMAVIITQPVLHVPGHFPGMTGPCRIINFRLVVGIAALNPPYGSLFAKSGVFRHYGIMFCASWKAYKMSLAGCYEAQILHKSVHPKSIYYFN